MLTRRFFRIALPALLPVIAVAATAPVPRDIDHAPLDALLRKYVDDDGRVDYRGWHRSGEDRRRLDRYLEQFARIPAKPAGGDERTAALINAYNAFTIDFVLDNFPTKSIRKLEDPFDGRRYRIGGKKLSADDIEHAMLRPSIGWKVHSVVVCAARSCPPLLNRAYLAEDWEEKMRERYRAWLAREDLNAYYPAKGRVVISKIFDWYAEDFDDPSVRKVLGRFGPDRHQSFLESGEYRIRYKVYRWGLNAQSDLGKGYEHGWLKRLF